MKTFVMPDSPDSGMAAIERKRKIAEMLATQGMTQQQGQMVGGRYIAPSPLSGIVQIGQILAAQHMNKGLDQQQSELEASRRTGMAEQLQKFLTTREGTPGQTMTDQQAENLMVNDQAPALADPVKADPRRAVLEAMTSQYPEMRQIGQMELGALLKPKSVDPSNIKEAGGQFFDLSSGKPVLLGGVEYGGTETLGGDLYQRGPGGKLIKLDNAPKISATATVAAGDKGMAKYLEKTGEALAPGGKSHEAALAANEALLMSTEALQAMKDGAKQGIAQPAMQVLRKVGAELGVQNAATAPTDALSAALKAATFKDLGGLGAQISDSDRKFVSKFSGDLSTDPQALKRMIALRIAAQMRRVNQHGKQVASFGRQVGDGGFEASAGVPLNITVPDDEVAAMVDNVMLGRPTTYGMASTAAPAARKAPIVKNW